MGPALFHVCIFFKNRSIIITLGMKLETLVNSPILKNRSIKTDLLEDLVRKLSLDEVAVQLSAYKC